VMIAVHSSVPLAVADSYSIGQYHTLVVEAPGLLANDSDPDGDPIHVAGYSQPAHGQVLVSSNGRVEYQADAPFVGTDSFQYRISDDADHGGYLSDWATVTITVNGADLRLLLVAAPDPVNAGEPLTYTVGLDNSGGGGSGAEALNPRFSIS